MCLLQVLAHIFREWFYTCIDLLEIYESYHPDEQNHQIKRFDLYREVWDTFWIDEVVIAPQPTTTDENRTIYLYIAHLFYCIVSTCLIIFLY